MRGSAQSGRSPASATVGPEATQVGGGRLAGTYGNPNHLGYLIALGSPVAVALLWPRDRRTAALFAIATLPLGIALLLSYSRGALIAGAVGMLATVAVAHIRTRQAALRFAVAIAAAAAIVALAYPLYLDARIERDRSDSDVAARGSRPQRLGRRVSAGCRRLSPHASPTPQTEHFG